MIPNPSSLKKMNEGLHISQQPYFELAHEYLQLKTIFLPNDLIDFGVLIFDLILYPIWILVSGESSLMDIFPLMKCGQLWKDLIRFQELSTEIWYWKFVVNLVGGPWISTNDPDYHTLVYADAMTRLSCV